MSLPPEHTGADVDAKLKRGGGLRLRKRRRAGSACVSNLMLDQLALGELDDAERGRVLAHVEGCAACRQGQAAITADRGDFLTTNNASALAGDALARAQQDPGRFRWWGAIRRLILPLGVCAGLAAVGLFGIAPPPERPVSGTRIKGGFTLSTYVKHHEQETAGTLHLGEPLHPGDHLQFRYNGGEDGYLAVVAVDATGKVSLYYPPGPAAERVQAGRDVPLTSAVELDGTLGREVIIAVRCTEALPIGQITEAATRSLARAQAAGRPAPELGPLELPCVETRQEVTKVAEPGRR